MELRRYIGKVVKLELVNGIYYKGSVEKVDDDSLSLIDKNGKWVDISIKLIAFIKEVEP